jgi:hypothetical protein
VNKAHYSFKSLPEGKPKTLFDSHIFYFSGRISRGKNSRFLPRDAKLFYFAQVFFDTRPIRKIKTLNFTGG